MLIVVWKWCGYLQYNCSEAMICGFTSDVSVASLVNLVNQNTMPSMCGSLCAAQIAFEVLREPLTAPSFLFEAIHLGSW